MLANMREIKYIRCIEIGSDMGELKYPCISFISFMNLEILNGNLIQYQTRESIQVVIKRDT